MSTVSLCPFPVKGRQCLLKTFFMASYFKILLVMSPCSPAINRAGQLNKGEKINDAREIIF